MDEEIRLFTGYLEEIKKLSRNTVMSYHGDLTKMAVYMKEQGITSTADIRGTTLNAYVLHMEKNGMSAATISRYIASMKAFFEYLVGEHKIDMTFNYHISVLKSPVPFKLGVDIYGSMEKMKFKITKAKYKNLFIPSKRAKVDSAQINVRNQIRRILQSARE